ncbi:hypothetical protein FRB91_010380 [Serendipita sp. 411]|nr:hypothetical protein FRC18_010008 [Serendipita sp. 400]KAG8848922.1 hypothetical protein FRB91_010380 [Serendipita sp. 411]
MSAPRSLAAQKKASEAFATPLSILDGSPSRKTKSPTRSSTSRRAVNPATSRATKTSPRRMRHGHGRETSVLGVIDSSKKRGRTEDEDDERELDEGPVSISLSRTIPELIDDQRG